jgi:hypothetical protein
LPEAHPSVVGEIAGVWLVLNLINCQFGRQIVDFLDYQICAAGPRPLLQHVAIINQFQQPADSKGPQTFLRLVNFYLVILFFFFLVLPAFCSIWQTPCK